MGLRKKKEKIRERDEDKGERGKRGEGRGKLCLVLSLLCKSIPCYMRC